MHSEAYHQLLDGLLDSWDRNNTILVNLLGLLPAKSLEVRSMDGSPSVAEMFMHVHYVRLVFVEEDVPEHAVDVPGTEWRHERDQARIATMLNESAMIVRNAVQARIASGQPMELHYDHPVLMLQHMIWHEGYHHGQIKLALKLAGTPIRDEDVGSATWGVWMNKARSRAE